MFNPLKHDVMRKILRILLIMFSLLAIEVQAEVATITMTFSEQDYTYYKAQYGETFIYAENLDIYYNQCDEPCLPYIEKTVAMPGNYTYNSSTYSLTQTLLVKSNTTLANAPEMAPTSDVSNNIVKNPADYDIKKYPTANVEMVATSRWPNLTVLHFKVCPFIYDARNKSLSFSNRMTLNINYSIINKLPGSATYTFTPSLLLQNFDYSFGYIPSIDDKEPEYGEDDVEYLIITCEKLKKSFQPLADWKKKKGVRSKIITVEDIIRGICADNLQIRIKTAIYRYYKNKKLKFVLLGGDNIIVPSLPCYCEVETKKGTVVCTDIPCDLYYACFAGDFNWDANGNNIYGEIDDNVDFDPSICVSRIPVTNVTEVETFVNKTINYEKNPKLTGQLLMAGVQLSSPIGDKSDSEYYADLLYERTLHNKYDGRLYKFFDTYTSATQDGSYDVTPENLKSVMSLGFNIIDMDTHGYYTHWDMEKESESDPPILFESKDASSYTCQYNGIIVTGACDTNAFDKYTDTKPCLCKAFMDNPNNGIVAYFGSSRAGWHSPGSVLYCGSLYYEESFYKVLCKSGNKENSFAGLTTEAKRQQIWKSNDGVMRWLQFSLNPIGDPEMQIYVQTAPSIPFSITTFANGDSIRVETNLKGCKICAYSNTDLGKNFYQVFKNTKVACFKNPKESIEIYLTKTRYRPTSKLYNLTQVVPPWSLISVNNIRQTKIMRVKYKANQDGPKALLTISDIMGNLKASYPLDPSCNDIEVDTSKVGSGIHIINLVVEGAACDSKKESF